MTETDDVLKARLKTVGVSEHRFHMEAAAGRESGTEWRIVDVGGSRSQVSAFHRRVTGSSRAGTSSFPTSISSFLSDFFKDDE